MNIYQQASFAQNSLKNITNFRIILVSVEHINFQKPFPLIPQIKQNQMRIISALIILSLLAYTTQLKTEINELNPFTVGKNPYRELIISFDYSDMAKQKISRIFDEHGFSLADKMKYTDPFEPFYVNNIDMTTYHPACPVCKKSFKSLEFLHLHIVRKHLLEILDASGMYVIFSDACEFMKCSKNQLIQDELAPINLQRCMNYLNEYFLFDNRNHMYGVCKDMVSQEQIDERDDNMWTQIFSWLGTIIFTIFSILYLAYIINERMSDRDKPVLIDLGMHTG